MPTERGLTGRLWPHHMMELFEEFDEDVRQVIGEVLWLEQENISRKDHSVVRPKIVEFIDQTVREGKP